MRLRTLDLGVVALGFSYHQSSRLAVQGVRRVRVSEKLRQEDLEDVDHVEHGRPSLVDDIQADGARPMHFPGSAPCSVLFPLKPLVRSYASRSNVVYSQLVDIGVENAIHESDTR